MKKLFDIIASWWLVFLLAIVFSGLALAYVLSDYNNTLYFIAGAFFYALMACIVIILIAWLYELVIIFFVWIKSVFKQNEK